MEDAKGCLASNTATRWPRAAVRESLPPLSKEHQRHRELFKERQPRMIKWYILGLTVLYFGTLVSSVNAADMWVQRSVDSSRTPLIFIDGDIVSGDYAKFKK